MTEPRATGRRGWRQPLLECGEAELVAALDEFVFLVPDAFYDAGKDFSCREIEAVAGLFRALGRPVIAAMIVAAHALGDSELEGDDPGHLEAARTQRSSVQ